MFPETAAVGWAFVVVATVLLLFMLLALAGVAYHYVDVGKEWLRYKRFKKRHPKWDILTFRGWMR